MTTTTTATYVFVYLHPSAHPRRRFVALNLPQIITPVEIIQKMVETFPDQSDDFKDCTLWKESR
jgi:hypothetical protein